MFEKITLQITPKDLQTTIGRTLGIYLLFIRTQRNITREQVCNETNVNFKSLDKIESGRAALTNMDIGYLLDYYHLWGRWPSEYDSDTELRQQLRYNAGCDSNQQL